ncbi:DUF3450 family protein [Neptunicella sp. SCSIO 80796]|uniref:DUF3450 family protein n=1 Tax=Neptunicella plasticusilytica TaxID=3117012 RepID=UPI003A4DD631
MVLLHKCFTPRSCGLLVGLLICSSQAQTVNQTEKLVGQWLDIERQTAALQQEWQNQQPMLKQRLELLEAESAQLQNVLDNSQGNNSEVDQQRSKLLAEQTELEMEQQNTVDFLQRLDSKLEAFQTQLPPVLLNTWQQEQAELQNNADTSTKLQIALAKLAKLAEFTQRITLNETAIQSPDGSPILVKQLYLGVSMAWFVSADQSYAGIGKVTDGAWQWDFRDDLDSAEISKAIAIYQKQQQAEFVQLPVQLTAAGAAQ